MILSHTASVEKDESDTYAVSWIWLFRPSSEKENLVSKRLQVISWVEIMLVSLFSTATAAAVVGWNRILFLERVDNLFCSSKLEVSLKKNLADDTHG